MAKPSGLIVTVLCTSVKVDEDERSYMESVTLGNDDAQPSATVYLHARSYDGKDRPAPLGFKWGKKYRVTVEPID